MFVSLSAGVIIIIMSSVGGRFGYPETLAFELGDAGSGTAR
jgi:hypothetical protein